MAAYISRAPELGNWQGMVVLNVVRNSQMIVVGGLITNNTSPTCDVPEARGQHGLLLGQESMEVQADQPGPQWWWGLDNNFSGYRIPDKIVSLVGGK